MQSATGQVCFTLGLQLQLHGPGKPARKRCKEHQPRRPQDQLGTICCVKLSQENLQPHSGSRRLAVKDKGCREEGGADGAAGRACI